MQKETNDIPLSEPAQRPGFFRYILSIARRSWLVAAVIITAFFGALLNNLIFPAPIPISQPEIVLQRENL